MFTCFVLLFVVAAFYLVIYVVNVLYVVVVVCVCVCVCVRCLF